MSVTIFTSSERAVNIPVDTYPPCCGLTPEAITWPRRKDLIAVICRNPACENRAGVLACDVDIRAKWERWRHQSGAGLDEK